MSNEKPWELGAGGIRINVHEDFELDGWSAKLGVTRWEIKAAVKKVGPMARDVARALGSPARLQ